MLPSTVHGVWPDRQQPAGTMTEPMTAAWAALAAGEPRHAASELDRLTASTVAVAVARLAVREQDTGWWPGGTTPPPTDPPAPTAELSFATLERSWIGSFLPMARRLHVLAAGARRAAVDPGRGAAPGCGPRRRDR